MTIDCRNLISAPRLGAWIAAIFAFLCVLLQAGLSVLGLPQPGDTPLQYADRFCRLAKVALDQHLPCLEDTANGSRKPMDRQALWSLVSTACIPASYFGIAFPCVTVNRREGYAVVKAPQNYGMSFIVTPTAKIPGMESLTRKSEDPQRLWLSAWEERSLLEQAANRKLNWPDVMLAINSKSTRSQDQLHIHLGCANKALRDFLATEPPSTGKGWQTVYPNAIPAAFFVKLLAEQAIKSDIFRVVFDEIPGGRMFAEKQTIAVAGITRGAWRGFALIVTLEPIAAEEFLARSC